MTDSSFPARASHPERPPHSGHSHLPGEWITAADVLAGAAIPIRLHLKINLRPDSPDASASGEIPRPAGGRRPVSLERRLKKHSAKLLEWAKDNPENARVLLMDPIGAAGYAGVKLSPAEREALAARVRARSLGDTLPPGVELVTLQVTASPATRENERSPKQSGKKIRKGGLQP